MDTETIDARGARPVKPLVDAVGGLRDVRDLAAFLGEFERVGGYGLFGSYVNTDAKDSDRYLFNVLQGGLGLPDESYYRDDKFAEIRDKYVAYLTTMFELGEHPDPAGGRRDRARDRHPARRRPLGARRDPRRPEDLQPDDARPSSRSSARRSTGTPTSATSAATTRPSPRCASGSRRTSPTSPRCSSETPIERLEDVDAQPGAARRRRRTSPTTSSR